MNQKKIPALFDSDSSSKKRARSPQPQPQLQPNKRMNSPRTVIDTTNTTNIKVFARFRPPNKQEELNPCDEFCVFPDNRTVLLQQDIVHTFDRVFAPQQKQHQIYNAVGSDAIQDVLNGYNSTIFAYGQTGSGKTYTMFGELRDSDHKGIIPRSIESIFAYINQSEEDSEFVLTCSMLEIYKETLYDLLSVNRPDLKIKESASRGIYVEGLTQLSFQQESDLLRIVEVGEQTRKVAATRINQYSSRSHTIFMLEIKQKLANETEKKGKLNLVDLAGSEKVGKTGAQGEILEEAKKINLSLSCLGNVIHALTTNNEHIPYRNSKLTRILQESLGGNYKTSLIVTCSSHVTSFEETVSTLKFAQRAKSIKNHFKMNVKMSSELMQQMIRDLKQQLCLAQTELEEIKRRSILDIPNEDNPNPNPKQYDSRMLSNGHKYHHQSFQSTPSVLSFFSSKKVSQAENEFSEVHHLQQQLQFYKMEMQKKDSLLKHQEQKIAALEKARTSQQMNRVLLDEIAFLNEQLTLVNDNSNLMDKLDRLNIEQSRKVELLYGMHQSKLTKVINKSQPVEEVMEKLTMQHLLNTLIKALQTSDKKIVDSLEVALRNPAVENALREYIKEISKEDERINILRLENDHLKTDFLQLQEQLQQLINKNQKLTDVLKKQNLNFQQKLEQQYLSEITNNQRPISQQGERIVNKQNRKPSTFFRYEEL